MARSHLYSLCFSVRWTACLVGCLAAWSAAAATGYSDPQRLAGPRFVYRAEGKRLAEVLQDFAASQSLPAVLAEGIDGQVQAQFQATPEEFLNAVAKAYGVLWYHDGVALYFYPARAIQSRLFRLKGYTQDQVEQLLASLQIGDRRYPLRFDTANSTLLVYGPPRHVELVASALESLDASAGERRRQVVRVFRLRFASAADRRYGDTVIPGIASSLRALFGQGAAATTGAGANPRDNQHARFIERMERLTYGDTREARDTRAGSAGTGAAFGLGMSPGSGSGQPRASTASAGLSAAPAGEERAPSFHAEESINAVLVRADPQEMDEYAELIRRLDVRPPLVELEAIIIDVNAENVDSLGVAWSARGSSVGVSMTPPGGRSAGDATPSSGTFSMGTVWANAGRELLARIEALQAEGKARVVSKPKVLGVVNRAAVMKDNRVVALRVSGNLEANLFQVEAGTQMQVTPQVTLWGDPTRLKLSLYIVDGNFEASQVDGIPVVRKTEIATEAHMLEGESLLLGGIVVESQTQHASGVPGLSTLPWVGGLFRQRSQNVQRSERLFLITPRLVRDVLDLPPAEPATENPPTGQR